MDWIGLLASSTALLTILAVYFHLKAFNFWSSRGVPGPTPWPIFGTSIYYIIYNKLYIDKFWRNKYGRTYGLYEGYAPLLRTTEADCIKRVYISQFSSYMERNNRFVQNRTQRKWLLWSSAEQWIYRRALITPLFSVSKLRKLYGGLFAGTGRFVDAIKKKLSIHPSITIDKRLIINATLDIFAANFLGIKLNVHNEKHDIKTQEFIRGAQELANLSLLRLVIWIFLPRQLASLLEFDIFGYPNYKYFEDLSGRITQERKTGATGRRDDVIQALIEAKLTERLGQVIADVDGPDSQFGKLQRPQTGGAFRSFDDTEIQAQMTFFFIAGFETIASQLTFSLHELSHQPAIQDELLTELRTVFGQKGEKLQLANQTQNYIDMLNLRCMGAFLSEVLRMYSPLIEHNRLVTNPNGVNFTYTSKDGNSRGFHLPKGVAVAVSPMILQRDSEYFERPDEFDISRFYPENADKIRTGTYMPFGLGPRNCVGMRFALMEVKLALAKLLLNFRVYPSATSQYPPTFLRNPFVLQYRDTSFRLMAHDG